MDKSKVLFLCVGNSARSQMAEAMLRHLAGDRFEAYSAGSEPKEINPLTRQVMQEIGITMEGQYSKSMTEYIGKVNFDWIINVCNDAERACPFFPGKGSRLQWGFDDPAAVTGSEEIKIAKFREVRDAIEVKIKSWLAEFDLLHSVFD
jgi:arsenate reductase (thioredoxin)